MEVAPRHRTRSPILHALVLIAAAGLSLLAAAGPARGQLTDPTRESLFNSAPRGTGYGTSRGLLGRPPNKLAEEQEKAKQKSGPLPEEERLRPGDVEVAEVRIVGNEAFKKERILPYIWTRAGRPYRMSIIEKDVRRLYRTGMFVTVEPLYEDAPGGGRVVIFKVAERPTLRDVVFVREEKLGLFDSIFSSAKRDEEKLQEKAGLKPGDPADPFAVEEARRALEDYYREKGFARVRVSVAEGDKPEDRRAVFVIHEGPKEKIVWTRFIGNTIASDARLLTQIESKQGIFWIFKGEFDRKKVEADEETLTAYYRSLGFFHARVGHDIQFVHAPFPWSEPKALITFVIDEGPRWKIHDVTIVGNSKIATSQLQEELKLHKDDFFNQNAMNADVRRIREQYGAVGHVFADVKAEPRFLEEVGQMDLVYDVNEGDRYRVGRIIPKISGENPHTKITTLLNPLSLQPGDIIDTREIRATETRYLASQVFNTDRQQGKMPKIVFSPADAEDDDNKGEEPPPQMAQPPRRPTDGFRGQSPDDDPRTGPPVSYPPNPGHGQNAPGFPAGYAPPGTPPYVSYAPSMPTATSYRPAAPSWVFLQEPRFELYPPSGQPLPRLCGPSPYRQNGGTR
ncbi:MAG: hypothetical protein JW719_09375 [Pirellulales bacterium]|nr:hypothetical protein [Pirellulales bacterium]